MKAISGGAWLPLLIVGLAAVGCAEKGVSPVLVDQVEITPKQTNVQQFKQLPLTAAVLGAGGEVLSGRHVTWRSLSPRLATVDPAGRVHGLEPGRAIIVATSDGIEGVAEIFVTWSVARINAGYAHTCSVASSGRSYCWGSSSYGRLGDGTQVQRAAPTGLALDSTLRVASISAGDDHSCAVTTDGSAYCWGRNDFGQLGNGTTISTPTPARVAPGLNLRFAAIAAGYGFTCGVATDGQGLCWGRNELGQLGDGTTTERTLPTAIAVGADLRFTSIAAGAGFACSLTTDGRTFCWGRNEFGNLGDGTSAPRRVPAEVAPALGLRFNSITLGQYHACGVAADGRAYCWGRNDYGQLGDASFDHRSRPVSLGSGPGLRFRMVSAGGGHSCGVATDERAYCWGLSDYGQLGDGTTVRSPSPQEVAPGVNLRFAHISAGAEHSCAVATDGQAYCWGRNESARLGDGSLTHRWAPVLVKSP